MPFVSAICTNCGATLKVDNSKDASICEFCGTPFIVEKAINNYNTTNNISNSVVNIFGGNSADFVIRAGTLEKYNGASTQVIIPDSVTSIGDRAFEECSGLTSVTIPDSVTSIGSSAFSGCSGLTKLKISDGLINIGTGAFSNCSSLQEFTIPNGVINIGAGAFSGCSGLVEITIPGKVKNIYHSVFNNSAFSNCSNLTHVTISDGIEYIWDNSFRECESIASVSLPESVKSIGKYAFSYCSSLSKITIPRNVTDIGEAAFCGCASLNSITIPDSVTSIGDNAFKGCSRLTSVTIPDSVTSIGYMAFAGCKLTDIRIPDTVKKVGGSFVDDNVQIVASKDWKKEHWNAHRSLNSYKPGEGCYIATSVYGSYDCPSVWTLRRYRDYCLYNYWLGRIFIKIYYLLSPTMVKLFDNKNWFKKFWQIILDKLVKKLNEKGYEDIPYNDK